MTSMADGNLCWSSHDNTRDFPHHTGECPMDLNDFIFVDDKKLDRAQALKLLNALDSIPGRSRAELCARCGIYPRVDVTVGGVRHLCQQCLDRVRRSFIGE